MAFAYTVPVSALRAVLSAAAGLGIEATPWLAELGVDAGSLASPEARVPEAAYHRAWALLETASGDADLGLHLAERMDLEAFDVMGHLVARSRTLGEGFQRLVAYSRLLHDAGRVAVEVRGPTAVVYPGCRGLRRAWPRQIAEFSAAATAILVRSLTGEPVVPRAVTFKHPRPAELAEHRRVLGLEPGFSGGETALTFDVRVLSLPIRSADAGLATYLDAYARAALARLPRDESFTSRVEHAVGERMPGGLPTLAGVARALAVTPRTLQRRLAAEQATWRDVLDGVRRTWAETYLSEERLPIAEVAFLVGFGDPSNFQRAFRRWTGLTPGAFRARRARR